MLRLLFPVVTVDGISAGALLVSQGSLDPPARIYNLDPKFATTDDDLGIALLQGTAPVSVSVANLTGDASQILWRLDRDPSEGDSATPSLSAASGPQVSFPPTVAGNFRLIAYIDLNHNRQFDMGEQLFVLRFAIVQATLQGAENFRSGLRFLRTGLFDGPAPGMSLDALYRVEGGGSQRTIGAGKVAIGNVGNLISDTFQVDYPPTQRNPARGTGTEIPGGGLPMLDASVGYYKPGGQGPFRGNSVATNVSGSPIGLSVRLASHDNPTFYWADPHPTTGNPAGTVSGGNGFREFVVAYSSYFPNVYRAFYMADWTATACTSGTAAIVPSTAVPTSAQPVTTGSRVACSMRYTPSGPAPATSVTCRNGPIPSPELADFAFGQAVGDSFARKCSVVYGELLTDVPKNGQPVEVRVKRSIVGSFSPGEIVEVRYAAMGTSPKVGGALAHAWDHVKFLQRAPVMAVLRRESRGDGRLDPVLVTSRTREFQIILSLLAQATSLAASSDEIRAAVASVVGKPDPALAGYLYSHIWHREALADPQLASELLNQLIGSPAIPAQAWREMAEDIALSYVLLEDSHQVSVVKRFMDLAQQPDPHAGFAGFRGLGKLARFVPLPTGPPDSLSGLTAAYQRLVKSEGMPRELALETALSIVFE